MPHTLKIAVTQMDVTPAPTPQRLERAARLVQSAAQEGAQLVVLPELFNTGYAYEEVNYQRAEPMTGPTVRWMKELASRLNLHLAGSLLLLDGRDVYNSMLLVAPNGRLWRYDKNHPWAWERAYFVDGREITVADTALGKIGLMVCADVIYPEMWERYAGQVDLIITSSSPPDVGALELRFPNGERVTPAEVSPLVSYTREAARLAFGEQYRANAAWLKVPAANSVHSGRFRSYLPNGEALVLMLAPGSPQLAQYTLDANNVKAEAGMVEGSQVVDANGRVLAARRQADGEGLAVAEVALPDRPPVPEGPPPALPPSLMVGNLISNLLAVISVPAYRSGLRRAYGPEMAPVHPRTRRRLGLVLMGLVTGLFLGLAWRRQRARA